MRSTSLKVLSAVAILAASAGTSAAQGAADKLTPPKRDDWRSTMLTCADGKRMTAVFAGPERLTVATPEGEYRMTRVKGDGVRYKNDRAEFVVQNGMAQLTSQKSGEHKECKPN